MNNPLSPLSSSSSGKTSTFSHFSIQLTHKKIITQTNTQTATDIKFETKLNSLEKAIKITKKLYKVLTYHS